MKIFKGKYVILAIYFLVFSISAFAQGQEVASQETLEQGVSSEAIQEQAAAQPEVQTKEVQAKTEKEGYVTVDFKDADIKNVLRIISYKAAVNIVPSPEVAGFITIRLEDVYWKNALDAILKTYGFGYDIQENIILVAPLDKLTTLKKMEQDLAQVQPTVTEVFELKYLDAQDARKAIEQQLSSRGKVTILEMTGQAGWEFGGTDTGKRKRTAEERMGRSKVIIISDIPPVMDKIRQVVKEIDIKPKQVLIEARLMEVNEDFLRDLGVDFGTGSSGAEGTIELETAKTEEDTRNPIYEIGVKSLGSETSPSAFGSVYGVSATEPYNAGLELVFKRLFGMQFEAIIHALEEDAHTNTLSAPRILTLNNQEAGILVGTRYPILKSEVSTYSENVIVTTLDYYQDIGIQLNVVPQIGVDNDINMVIHPAVTSFSTTVSNYPIITTREAETRILMKDGETIMIGGLLRDIKAKSTIGIPFLKSIPLVGGLFRRDTYDDLKVDLLVFITAKVIEDSEVSDGEFARMQKNFSNSPSEKK